MKYRHTLTHLAVAGSLALASAVGATTVPDEIETESSPVGVSNIELRTGYMIELREDGSIVISFDGVDPEDIEAVLVDGVDLEARLAELGKLEGLSVEEAPSGVRLVLDQATKDVLVGAKELSLVLGGDAKVSMPLRVELDPAEKARRCSWVTFSPPVRAAPVASCGFGSTRCYNRKRLHTGVDYSTSEKAMATADGVVVALGKMGRDSSDHGMGINVIVAHTISNCSKVYSTYSHLKSYDKKLAIGKKVKRGDAIGTVGGSGYGKPDYWSKHVHFEIKLSPVTGNPFGVSGTACPKVNTCWGYVPGNPTSFGYLNPASFF